MLIPSADAPLEGLRMCCSSGSPGPVGCTPLLGRSISGVPSVSSVLWIWRLSAEGDTWSSSAAFLSEPAFATS